MHYRDGETDAQWRRREKPGQSRDSGGAGMPEPACEGIPIGPVVGIQAETETASRQGD